MLLNFVWPGQVRKRLLKQTATNANRQMTVGTPVPTHRYMRHEVNTTLCRSGDGAFDERGSVAFIAPLLLGVTHAKIGPGGPVMFERHSRMQLSVHRESGQTAGVLLDGSWLNSLKRRHTTHEVLQPVLALKRCFPAPCAITRWARPGISGGEIFPGGGGGIGNKKRDEKGVLWWVIDSQWRGSISGGWLALLPIRQQDPPGSASQTEKRGSYKGDTTTLIKCAIATKRKALNWRGVLVALRVPMGLSSTIYLPGGVAPEFSHEGIMPDDAVGWRVFSEISRFLHSLIPVLLHTHFASWASAGVTFRQVALSALCVEAMGQVLSEQESAVELSHFETASNAEHA
ncbi:hypothetical protein PR048_028972 [Dryococelus australis]|uniref:Uncharacterized protein n=1 Tax=Dryococelus australis TaxID=614101 RepID=A0ABQ9GC44_9NEOP|nr:hypothetical protein PR048_028972 [Dryococelus australis]